MVDESETYVKIAFQMVSGSTISANVTTEEAHVIEAAIKSGADAIYVHPVDSTGKGVINVANVEMFNVIGEPRPLTSTYEDAIDVICETFSVNKDELGDAMLDLAGRRDGRVKIGYVKPFDAVEISAHDEVRKLVEEAAEVFSAWYVWDSTDDGEKQYFKLLAYDDLLSEIGDVIQVVANLLHSIGVDDAGDIVDQCLRSNVARGRIKPITLQ